MAEQADSASRQSSLLTSNDAASENGDSICESCRKIDFHDLIRNPHQGSYETDTTWLVEKSDPHPHTMRYSGNCRLCRLMFQDTFSDQLDDTHDLRSYTEDYKTVEPIEYTDPGAEDVVFLKINPPNPYKNTPDPFNTVFCKLAGDGLQSTDCALSAQTTWNAAVARLWLDGCAGCHNSVGPEESVYVSGMNLIDCKHMVIVQARQEMRWLALSYVWGKTTQAEDYPSYCEGSSMPDHIPKTIGDAISVTLELGYRYLWVDEYCINQSDHNHRNDQIMKMDRIYHGADLTIVAAAGDNKMYGLPGVGSTERKQREVICVDDVVVFSNGPDPRVEIWESTWYSRAWTFQEGSLSKRLLVFTEYNTTFYCESNPKHDPTRQSYKNRHHPSAFSRLISGISTHWSWMTFTTLLQMYCSRRITKEADILDAFVGVLNHIRRSHPTTHLLRGLPLCPNMYQVTKGPLVDSLEYLVAAALSWNLIGLLRYKSAQRRSIFPSWTWAGWSWNWADWTHGMPISWFHDLRESGFQPSIRHVQLQSSTGHVDMSSMLYKVDLQQELDAVMLIQFEAAMIPAASFSVEESLKMCDHEVHCYSSCTDDHIVANVQRGLWSCLVLCAANQESKAYKTIYVLIVCWKADQVTAERIGSFTLDINPVEIWPPEETWTWRRVRLI